MIKARDVTPRKPTDPPCVIYCVAEYANRCWEVTYSFEDRDCAESYVRSHESPERCRVFECRERRKA